MLRNTRKSAKKEEANGVGGEKIKNVRSHHHQHDNDRVSGCLLVDQVPYEFREPFIVRGYRHPNSGVRACLGSLVALDNNEVLNFWTHFVPFVFVCAQLVRFCARYDVRGDEFAWPLFVYLCTIAAYLLMSASAHAFNCMSPIARHLCFIVDYMSISIYGLGSAISYKAYSLKLIHTDHEFFDHFIALAIVFTLATNMMSCASRFIVSSHHKRRLVRLTPFIVTYIFINLPVVYRYMYSYQRQTLSRVHFLFAFLSSKSFPVVVSDNDNEGVNNDTYKYKYDADPFYSISISSATLSALLYSSHIPERFFALSGRFDIVGQSHQIFHLAAFACTWSQFVALQHDMDFLQRTNSSSLSSLSSELTRVPFTDIHLSGSFVLAFCLVVNSLILVYFYHKAVYFNPWIKKNETKHYHYH